MLIVIRRLYFKRQNKPGLYKACFFNFSNYSVLRFQPFKHCLPFSIIYPLSSLNYGSSQCLALNSATNFFQIFLPGKTLSNFFNSVITRF